VPVCAALIKNHSGLSMMGWLQVLLQELPPCSTDHRAQAMLVAGPRRHTQAGMRAHTHTYVHTQAQQLKAHLQAACCQELRLRRTQRRAQVYAGQQGVVVGAGGAKVQHPSALRPLAHVPDQQLRGACVCMVRVCVRHRRGHRLVWAWLQVGGWAASCTRGRRTRNEALPSSLQASGLM